MFIRTPDEIRSMKETVESLQENNPSVYTYRKLRSRVNAVLVEKMVYGKLDKCQVLLTQYDEETIEEMATELKRIGFDINLVDETNLLTIELPEP